MSILSLVYAPAKILEEKAAEVKNIDNEVKKLVNNMFDTMYKNNGVGLAAPQVNESLQILVIDCSNKDNEFEPRVLINPIIKKQSKIYKEYEEGCLSFPEHFAEIDRPDKLKIEYIDENNKKKILSTDGFNSRIIQHELDHLNGILFVDHLSRLKRDVIIRKMKKFKKEENIV